MKTEHIEVLATCGSIILMDKEDYHLVKGKSISLGVQRRYGMIKEDEELKYIHRLVVDVGSGWQVDHINMNTLDNRKVNLRVASVSQNRANQKKSVFKREPTSKYKGICFDKSNNNWISRVDFENQGVFKGRFPDEISAALAYNYHAKLVFGEFARINDIPEECSFVDWRAKQIKKNVARVQSGYKYVTQRQSKWQVAVTIDGKQTKIGRYINVAEAVLNANKAVIDNKLHLLEKYPKSVQSIKETDIDLLSDEQKQTYYKQIIEMERWK